MIFFIYFIVAALLIVLIALVVALSSFHSNVQDHQLNHKDKETAETGSSPTTFE